MYVLPPISSCDNRDDHHLHHRYVNTLQPIEWLKRESNKFVFASFRTTDEREEDMQVKGSSHDQDDSVDWYPHMEATYSGQRRCRRCPRGKMRSRGNGGTTRSKQKRINGGDVNASSRRKRPTPVSSISKPITVGLASKPCSALKPVSPESYPFSSTSEGASRTSSSSAGTQPLLQKARKTLTAVQHRIKRNLKSRLINTLLQSMPTSNENHVKQKSLYAGVEDDAEVSFSIHGKTQQTPSPSPATGPRVVKPRVVAQCDTHAEATQQQPPSSTTVIMNIKSEPIDDADDTTHAIVPMSEAVETEAALEYFRNARHLVRFRAQIQQSMSRKERYEREFSSMQQEVLELRRSLEVEEERCVMLEDEYEKEKEKLATFSNQIDNVRKRQMALLDENKSSHNCKRRKIDAIN